jgi:uncharacterized phage protein gp47/JayE
VALTLAQLLATPAAAQVRDRIFARLNVAGFPISDYYPGSAGRTLLEAIASAINDEVATLVPQLAAGSSIDLASGLWLTWLAEQRYGLTQSPATYTTQTVTLTDTVSAGPYSLSPGDVVVMSLAGKRYILDESGTIPKSNKVALRFKAESPGASYADPAGTITRLVTSYPGVAVDNPAPSFSTVVHLGPGTGTIATGTPPSTPRAYTIRIDITGQPGAATFSISTDGAAYDAGGTVPVSPAVATLPGGATVTFVAGVNPSFIAGDTYVFSSPGTPILTQGRDEESDAELRERMRAQLPSSAENATSEVYEMWAKRADAQVTKVRVEPSEYVSGVVNVTIAGDVNPLSGATVTLVQNYLNQRAPVGDKPAVAAASAVEVTAQGTVLVRADQIALVQEAAQAAWNRWIADLPLGGTIRAAELVQAIMDAGAIDATGILIKAVGLSGFAATYKLPGTGVAAASATPLSTLLAWAPTVS